MSDTKYWQFYCWRCEQWCERRGPSCWLFEEDALTSECIFLEEPRWANGVPVFRDPTGHSLTLHHLWEPQQEHLSAAPDAPIDGDGGSGRATE